MHICVKLSFQPLNNSKGVFGIAMAGTQFNIYIIVFSASAHKDLGRLKLLSILHTMSNNVWFLLSATPFGEPDIVY